MISLKRTALFFLLLLSILCAVAGYYYLEVKAAPVKADRSSVIKNTAYRNGKNFRPMIADLSKFIAEKNFNKRYIFLVDMSIASGKKRFFVYDMEKDSIVENGMVAHGRCNQDFLTGRKYGNEVGCGCTSLGKYKIGAAYSGRFGKAFKLHGLDETNSNAYKRFVVLHSFTYVPNNEVDPYPICQSDGCPMVAPLFLTTLAKYIEASKQPILLYIYDKP